MEGEEELVDSSLYELTPEEKKNPKIEKVVIHRASYNLAQKALVLVQKKEVGADRDLQKNGTTRI